ncbi:MAG: hypothetical protein A2Y74_05620 [Actinobacteria bacterium RBG_13_63_9]|nr:MAG: hypothetical protein A2Y74_05620 [Actinobacteria bacterium RBG_13_63_9]
MEALRLTVLALSRRVLAVESAADGVAGSAGHRATLLRVAFDVDIQAGELMGEAFRVAGFEMPPPVGTSG